MFDPNETCMRFLCTVEVPLIVATGAAKFSPRVGTILREEHSMRKQKLETKKQWN